MGGCNHVNTDLVRLRNKIDAHNSVHNETLVSSLALSVTMVTIPDLPIEHILVGYVNITNQKVLNRQMGNFNWIL